MRQQTISIGDIRHDLQLIERVRDKKTNRLTHFKCKCLACGNTTVIHQCKFGTTKSCGCYKHRRFEDNPQFKGVGELHMARWWTYKRNAELRKLEFTVTIQEAWDKFVEQNKCCALTGEPLYFWASSRNQDKTSTASMDRIDNTKGYTKDNIHWVHWKINQIKMDLPLEEFKQLCKQVTEYENNK